MNYLIVSPAFPPFSGVGAMRAYSLANYLEETGNQVYVIRNSVSSWGVDNCKSTCNSFEKIVDVDIDCSFEEAARKYTEVISSVLENTRIDVIIYSCSPYYIAKSAVEVKKQFGVKTVVDFRDLWIDDEFLTRNILKRILKFIKKIPYWRDEYRTVKYADLVLTVTPLDCKVLRRKYSRYSDKIECVLNGYDSKRALKEHKKYEGDLPQNYIGVFGKFGYYDLYYATQMLKAVKKYNETSPEPLKIVHIGAVDKTTKKALRKAEVDLETYINVGYQEYSVGMDIIKNAKANCLIAHYKRGLGTKVFDYIYADRPIIYFVPKGSSIHRILSEGKNAHLCKDSNSAMRALGLIECQAQSELGFDSKQEYSREERNKEYEELMERMMMNV